MAEPIISISGLRGVIGTELTPVVAARFASAFATTLPAAPASIVLGRDGRASGPMLARAVTAALQGHGYEVVDLDVAATPTVGIEVRRCHAVGGIQISASHNPPEYNGLKLFGADGRVLNGQAGQRVREAYCQQQAAWKPHDQLGAYRREDDPHAAHLAAVLATVDADEVRRCGFRVLLDSNHGAGGVLGKRLLEALGCEIDVVGGTPDGQFEHPPEPIEANLQTVCKRVREGQYDVGFCQDPDADRLAIIDEQGRYIGEEMTLVLCLMQVLAEKQGTVVTNCATSNLSKLVAAEYGCRLLQSPVGEANVADLMIREQAVFGGEGNGGPIDPQVGYVRDSFVGMARVLSLLARSKQPISQLVGRLPPLAIHKDKAPIGQLDLRTITARLIEHFKDAQSSMPDGLKLEWPDRWLLVRGSNTEPVVRFIAEAPTASAARELCEEARRAAGIGG